MNNSQRVEEFKKTLAASKQWFPHVSSLLLEEKDIGKYNSYEGMKIIWSEDTVKSILEQDMGRRVAALNFADGWTPGGLVWEGVKTQEEDLCRSSNLYLSLVEEYYPIDGKVLYSKDIVFFRGSNLEKLEGREWRICDIISCPAEVRSSKDAERRMRMILNVAMDNKIEVLILGKWGCGAFGNDWEKYKRLWEKVLKFNELQPK